jgi:predicted histidine transporter YuiF (NhaC family)
LPAAMAVTLLGLLITIGVDRSLIAVPSVMTVCTWSFYLEVGSASVETRVSAPPRPRGSCLPSAT